jgi:HSP20 family protein
VHRSAKWTRWRCSWRGSYRHPVTRPDSARYRPWPFHCGPTPSFYICLDLPGINPDSIDLTVEQNVLTVRAERAPVQADGAQMIVAERPSGTFTRQVFLGETLDADHIAADYAAGVLTLTIPVREAAKPRSIQVTSSDAKQAVTA